MFVYRPGQGLPSEFVEAPWFIDGSATVSGDYVAPESQTPQFLIWSSTGTDGTITLPLLDITGNPGDGEGFVFLILNDDATDSVQVMSGADGDEPIGDPIPPGVWAFYRSYDYEHVPVYQQFMGPTSSGSGFVNPMPNNSPLQAYLADGVTAGNIVEIDTSNYVVIGGGGIGTIIQSTGSIFLYASGGERIRITNSDMRPNSNGTYNLGTPSQRWGRLYVAFQSVIVQNASYTVLDGDQSVTVNITDDTTGRTVTLPVIDAAMVGRRITISLMSSGGIGRDITVVTSGGQSFQGSATWGIGTGLGVTSDVIALEGPSATFRWSRIT